MSSSVAADASAPAGEGLFLREGAAILQNDGDRQFGAPGPVFTADYEKDFGACLVSGHARYQLFGIENADAVDGENDVTGKDSGAGFPAAKLMAPGVPRLLMISRIADGFILTILSEILYSMLFLLLNHRCIDNILPFFG